MNGDTWITSFRIQGNDHFIIEQDNQAKTIKVHVTDDTDVTNLVPVFTLSEGATASLESGKPVNFTMPVVVKVTNGNVFMNYTISVETDKPQITKFMIGESAGRINETDKTILVYVLDDVDVTALSPIVTVPDGATVSPLSGTTPRLHYSERIYCDEPPECGYLYRHGRESEIGGTDGICRLGCYGCRVARRRKNGGYMDAGEIPGARYVSYLEIRDGNVILARKTSGRFGSMTATTVGRT